MFQLIGFSIAGLGLLIVIITLSNLRVVVATNSVAIVQSSRKTTSYGRGLAAGNTYYAWPSWMPGIGVRTTLLPVSVFNLPLQNYNAYDKGRVPFVIDIMAFFRINESNMAAERVHSFQELQQQLEAILQGAARTILATSDIEEILESRAVFGDKFTQEVEHQLVQWGVVPVKNIELMDIRDAEGSKVISNIMAKKKSLIEMESRVAVANNTKTAQLAEIAASRDVAVNNQEAQEAVGIRTAQKDQQIGIQNQRAAQAVKDEEKVTTEKQVAVNMAAQVGQANIDKQQQIVSAERDKEVTIIHADASKQQATTVAEGALAATKLTAEGIEATGNAKAAAERALQLAPVTAQITLAKEIGQNSGYQSYLVTVRQIEAAQVVGVEQAKAFTRADVKIIANSGKPVDGATSVMELFGSSGGQRLGAFLEGLKNTPTGEAVLRAANGGTV